MIFLAIFLYILPVIYQLTIVVDEEDTYIEIFGWPIFMTIDLAVTLNEEYDIIGKIKSIFSKKS